MKTHRNDRTPIRPSTLSGRTTQRKRTSKHATILFVMACAMLSLWFDRPTNTLFVNSLSMKTPSLHNVDSTACKTNNNLDTDNNKESNSVELSRRTVLGTSLVGVLGASTWFSNNEQALAFETDTGNGKGPVAVIGASGRTGSLCVTACLRRGIPVKALTRTGEWTAPPTPDGAITTYTGDTSGLLTIDKCDVTSTDLESLQQLLEGCSAVIYAASASKQGGTAIEIDNKGVCKVAQAAVSAKVPRYIVISSTSTTRPKSLGYIFTNLGVGGNIMGEKRNGEVGTMDAYKTAAAAAAEAACSYTIVRPGGLEEPKRNSVVGPQEVELSQGDVFAGVISRADVAETTVELALSKAPNLQNTAVELYYSNSVVEVQGSYKQLLAKAKIAGSPENKQLRLHGTTYTELFQNIRPNIDFAQ